MDMTTVITLTGIALFLAACAGSLLLSRKPLPTVGTTHRQPPRQHPVVKQPEPAPVVTAPRQLRRLPMRTYRLRQRRKVQRMTAVIKAQGERIKELEAKLLEALVLAEV